MQLVKHLFDNFQFNREYRVLYFLKNESKYTLFEQSLSNAEILYVTKGENVIIIENKKYSVGVGDLIIIRPNFTYLWENNRNNCAEYISIGIENLYFAKNGSSDFSPIIKPRKGANEVLSILKAIECEIENKHVQYEYACYCLLRLLLITITRISGLMPTADTSKKINKECAFIKTYIDENYASKITLDSLAGKTFMSKYHLVHAFKKYTGRTPINYLIERRIIEAKNLLQKSNYSITEVSKFVGFNNPAYFSLLFKKITGIAPKGYRQ